MVTLMHLSHYPQRETHRGKTTNMGILSSFLIDDDIYILPGTYIPGKLRYKCK
jgi:hypothetical protein